MLGLANCFYGLLFHKPQKKKKKNQPTKANKIKIEKPLIVEVRLPVLQRTFTYWLI